MKPRDDAADLIQDDPVRMYLGLAREQLGVQRDAIVSYLMDKVQKTGKTGGVVYTPRWLSDFIVRETLSSFVDNVLEQKQCRHMAEMFSDELKFADLCCGIGTFALSVLGEISRHLKVNGIKSPQRKKILKKIYSSNIFLADIDPTAIDLARNVVDAYSGILFGHKLEFPETNLRCQDILLSRDNSGNPLAKKEQRFHIIVGNPPYLSNKDLTKTDPILARSYSNNYSWMVENADLYVAFVQHVLEDLLYPGGVLGYVISNKWLSQNYGKRMLQELIDNYTVRLFVDFEGFSIFPGISVDAVVIIVQNESPSPNHRIRFLRPKSPISNSIGFKGYTEVQTWQDGFKTKTVSGFPTYQIRPRLVFDPQLHELVLTIEKNALPLGKIAYIREGIKIHSKTYRDKSKRRPKSTFIHNHNGSGCFKHLIDKTSVIEKFHITSSGLFLDYQPSIHLSPAFPELFETPKIVVTNVSGYEIKAALDESWYYTSHNVINLVKLDLLPDEISRREA